MSLKFMGPLCHVHSHQIVRYPRLEDTITRTSVVPSMQINFVLHYYDVERMNMSVFIYASLAGWRMLAILLRVVELKHCLKESRNVRAFLEGYG